MLFRSFQPGTQTGVLRQGVHAPLGTLAAESARTLDFTITLNLLGTQQHDIVPVGKDTTVSMKAGWPHPSFSGRYLPERREVGAAGFEAQWQTSHFATNLQAQFEACARDEKHCDAFAGNTLGVSFIQPVDIYQQAERSLKYAFLFVGLTFIAFFLFEVLKRMPVHPVQYSLVGAALVMF